VRFFIIFAVLLFIPLEANSHRSGCHRWHSCPSDSGKYICGDTGYCNYCPDSKYCKNGSPRLKEGTKENESRNLNKIKNEPATQNIQNSSNKKALPEGTHKGKVVGISDGDTLTLLVNNTPYKIRLAEIDTPERGQPYGTQSKKLLSELAFGKEVTVHVQTTDRYGRSVARIYVDDVDVNADLVKQGAAWVYRKYAKDESLFELEKQAMEAKLGLWGLPEAERVPPWEWRKKN